MVENGYFNKSIWAFEFHDESAEPGLNSTFYVGEIP